MVSEYNFLKVNIVNKCNNKFKINYIIFILNNEFLINYAYLLL